MEVTARAILDLKGIPTMDQINRMIEGCDNLRDRVLIRILSRTGMRVSELVKPGADRSQVLGLRVTNILWSENAFIIRHAKRKDNPPRRINVDPKTLAMLREYLNKRPEESEFVIPITRQMAYLVVRQAAERIGITEIGDPLVTKRRHFHPHHLRHAFCTVAIKRSGGKLEEVARLQRHVGHASISTTMSYLDISDEEQRKWYNDLCGELE